MNAQTEKPGNPQAPPFANDQEIFKFLERPLLARFSSHNPDGTIHIAPLYFLFQEGSFFFGTQPTSRKVKNIRNNNLVSVLVDTNQPVLRSVLVYGQAELDSENVLEKRIAILTKYGRSAEDARSFVQKLEKAWGSILIRLKPVKMITVDYSQPFSID